MRYLLDTNTYISLMRKEAAVVARAETEKGDRSNLPLRFIVTRLSAAGHS